MGPVALLVFKTSAPANNGLVSSTLTRLRQPSRSPFTLGLDDPPASSKSLGNRRGGPT